MTETFYADTDIKSGCFVIRYVVVRRRDFGNGKISCRAMSRHSKYVAAVDKANRLNRVAV